MKFDDLDKKMRVFETASDHCVLPGVFMVARIDGRSFSRLTKDTHAFEAPFDVRFRDLMAATTEHLMDCGFQVIYGYTQSDEISLLFAREESTFRRKTRKYNSVLAGEASARFALLLGAHACFDCRICELPNPKLVVDYFRWRSEDAHRNALNAHCYWMLRKKGLDLNAATGRLVGMTTSAKNELLFENGTNFFDLPLWQKRGIGIYWETCEHTGINPLTGGSAVAKRRRLHREMDLPMREHYGLWVEQLLNAADPTRQS
ncbi:MAG TPA: tRNA(His) guanylyltransferase Thg1 family protein [Tepidisphaeraceae bacterium]|nr:tRNA(His) guanylyltransferase Thg1 family protein [Tepidisphaeraceae bacterium]